MARYLTNETELIEYIKRKIGSEIWEVEITHLQWEDILQDSKEEFYNYSEFGLVDKWIVIETDGVDEYQFDDTVRAVVQCYAVSTQMSLGSYLIPSDTFIYNQLVKNTQGSISCYLIMNQYLDTVRQQFSEQVIYDFNTESRLLRLGRNDYKQIALKLLVEESSDKLVNNKYFKMLVESFALRQWSRNIALKYDTTNASIIGNGLSLNPDRMLQEAERLEDMIKEGLDQDEFGTLSAPRRLY